MRINTLAVKSTAQPLKTDATIYIRQHRNDPRHRRLIANYRTSHPLCERCIAGGHTRSTEHVHHIIEVAEGGPTENENLLALCRPCHQSIDEVSLCEQRQMKVLEGFAKGDRGENC